MIKKNTPYWLKKNLITGKNADPESGGILIVGSGVTGVSTAYWLYKYGFRDLKIVDFEPEKSASFRNCGHILNGTVESMKALKEIHGLKKAREIWQFSVDSCEDIKKTVTDLNLECQYRQDGYLVMAIDSQEAQEIKASTPRSGCLSL